MSERPSPPQEKTVTGVVRNVRENVDSTGDPFADFNKGLGLREKPLWERVAFRIKNIVRRQQPHQDSLAGKSREEQLRMQNVVDFTPTSTNTAGESLPPAPDHAPSREVVEQLSRSERVKVPGTKKVIDGKEVPDSEQELVVHTANMPEHVGPETTVNLWTGLMANDNAAGESHYRLVRLGDIGEPVMAIDPPQMGGSDPLTEEQKSEKYADVFEGVADAYVNVLQSKGVRSVNLLGYSMGGTLMAAVAERIAKHNETAEEADKIKVGQIELFDPAGVKKFTLPGLGIRNRWELRTIKDSLPIDHPLDHALPPDPDMIEASSMLLPDEEIKAKDKAFDKRFVKEMDPGFVYTKAMTKATVEPRLSAALQGLPDLQGVTLHTGSKSWLSPENAVRSMLGRLRELDGGRFAGKVHQVVKQGEGHFFNANAKLLAADVKRALKGSALDVPPQESQAV